MADFDGCSTISRTLSHILWKIWLSNKIPYKKHKQCGALRWLWIDEVEATGADTIGDLEHNIRFHISAKSLLKYDSAKNVRVFGGVNVFMGDFWQLRPTGQIALMSSPFAQKAMEKAKAQQIMNMFWNPGISFSLQQWPDKRRMLHFGRQ